MTTQALTLLILLNIGHWAADYTHLSTAKMLAAKRFGKPFLPIFWHAFRHGLLAYFFVFMVSRSLEEALVFGSFMLVTHFAIDLLKGRLNGWFPVLQSPANPYHWYVFGADQFLHQLVIILIVFWIG